MSPALLPLPILLAMLPGDSAARDLVNVRTGDHPGHGRVVFDWPRPTGYGVDEQAGRVLLRFDTPADFDLTSLRRPVRNVHGVEAGEGTATITTAPGARLRHFRLQERIVVDLMDAEPAAAHAPLPSTAHAPMPVQLASVASLSDAVEHVATDAAPVQAAPVQIAQAPAMPMQLPPPSLTPRPTPSERVDRDNRLGRSRLAQGAPAVGQPAAAPAGAAPPPPPTPVEVRLQAGTGRLLSLPSPASTVMAADPRIARVQPSSPTSVFVMAVSNGRTTVIATDDLGRPVAEFDVTIFGQRTEPTPGAGLGAPAAAPSRPLNAAAMESQIRTLLGGPGRVQVRVAGRAVVLTGTVANAGDARRAESIVRGMANDDTQILNELAVLSSIQVNLRVRVAEISRDLTRQFGLNWAAIGSIGNFTFGLVTGPSAGVLPNVLAGGLGAAGTLGSPQRLGARYRAGSTDINGIIDALAADNLITILAEPNLTAQSGEVANFLAGGEFPVPVASRDNSITVEFKPFGVSLAFVPVVLSEDRLTLRVRPEVSELSDQGAINLPTLVGSLRIPALSVRRAETTVELGSGQSFAIAGLLQRNTSQVQEGVNGLTDLPVLGALFRSERFQRRETELVIIVTPYLVQPVSEPSALTAPTDNFRPATSLERILRQRQLRGDGPAVPPLPAALGFRFE
ncbi:type II and III secretion system protein family protein [Falsiroseomonas sp.]|uniref:type II and III secretion system protein family protein n=1 Tax=Falsiroseomonas sp. TaxID=2870721 RepID=UPI003563CBB4